MSKFIVIQSNPNQKNGFVTKISRQEEIKTPFGMKTKKETYYVSGSERLEKDAEITVDMNMFRVEEYPMVNPDSGETFMGKWLHLR